MAVEAKLLLVGCGKMGGALLERVASSKPVFSGIHVVKPSAPAAHLKSLAGVAWFSSLDDVEQDLKPGLVVLAFKPQQMDKILPLYARFRGSVYLSIAAGTTLTRLENLLGRADYSIVRAMPNLPASIGQGISTAIANKNVSAAQHELCDIFLKTVGDVVWLEDENLMDAAAILSASGPAHVFALCDALAKAGEVLGLPSAVAMQLARRTVSGSGALLAQSGDSTATLRQAVTSPGGVTEAALKILLAEGGLDDLMLKAMTAGVKRAKELGR